MTDTDRAGRTPLHYAALENDVALLQRLVAEGADPNARDRQGFTPLHFACQQGAAEAVRALIEAGAQVDARDNRGTTPLMEVVLSAPTCQGEIITLLREQGADPLARDDAGETPTSWARKIANYDFAQYFEDVLDVPQAATTPKPLRPEATRQASDARTAHGRQQHEWQEEYQRLWDELVPPRGQGATVQGELVRCIGRLTDEAYRNGNQNWTAGSGHARMLAYIERTLLGDATLDVERQAAIRKDVAEIGDFEHPDTSGRGTCYYTLMEAVVDWCLQHPEPIPREADPDLHM